MTTAPQHLPILSRGAHNDPADGACLMEYVSLLAGEAFSDRPRCTHPLLAQIARLVNDTSPDSTRHELAPLAPSLIGTSGSNPRTAPALVSCCSRVGLAADPSAWRLRRHGRRARQRLERMERSGPGAWARSTDPLYEYGSAAPAVGHALAAISRLPEHERQEKLRQLLVDASAACRTYGRTSHPDGDTAETPLATR